MPSSGGLPLAVPAVLFLLATAFCVLGVVYLNQSTLRAREAEVDQFSQAVAKWDHFRNSSFDHLSFSVAVRRQGAHSAAAHLPLHKVLDPDAYIDDDEGQASPLPQYLPLRFSTNTSFPDADLPPEPFQNATTIELVFAVTFAPGPPSPGGRRPPPVHSTMTTAFLPTTRIQRVRAPQPAPETKCMVQRHGVLDYAAQECVTYEQLSGVCVQVAVSTGGHVSLSPAPPAALANATTPPAPGAPTYGCDAARSWSPAAYAPMAVSGHSTDDVSVPDVNITGVGIVVRSALDPYLSAQVITHDSMTFGLSSSSCLAVGATCLALGLVLAVLAAAAARRYVCDAMGDSARADTYRYGQLEDAINDNVLSPASSISVYSLSPPWRHKQYTGGVELFSLAHRRSGGGEEADDLFDDDGDGDP